MVHLGESHISPTQLILPYYTWVHVANSKVAISKVASPRVGGNLQRPARVRIRAGIKIVVRVRVGVTVEVRLE